MPGKQARALCPVCQEPMPPDETECANCGAFVIDEAVVRLCRAFGIDREKALQLFEKGFRHPRQLADRDVESVLQGNVDGLLYICTNCGSFVAATDSTCGRCGAEFEGEAPEDVSREERDILDLVLCPVCGADNEPTLEECEICGEPLGRTSPAPATPPPEGRTGRPEGEGVCPTCGRPWTEGTEAGPMAQGSTATPARHERTDATTNAARPPCPPSPVPRAQRPSKIARVPKVVRPLPRPAAKSAEPTAPAKEEARETPQRPTAPRPGKRAEPTEPAQGKERGIHWTGDLLPPEFSSSVVAATAVGLFLSNALDQRPVVWGIAFLLAVLVVHDLAGLRRWLPVRRTPHGLLLAGVLVGLSAPLAPGPAAALFAVAGAIPLALATRRLLGSRSRGLLALGGGAILLEVALAAAWPLEYAREPAWTLELLAALPWPTAVALKGLRHRRSSRALHRELGRAEQTVARRDFSESLRAYDRAIAVSPKGTPGEDLPWYGKGATLILLGRYEEALRAIDKALDINPHNEVAWLNKGNALTKLGRPVDALRCYDAAIQVNPRYEVAWNNKGNTLARLGRLEEALGCYEKALDIDPTYRGAWVNKGYVLAKLGRYEEATECADRALRLGGRPRPEAA